VHWAPTILLLAALLATLIAWRRGLDAEREFHRRRDEENERALEEMREQQRRLFESMAEGVLLLDRGEKIVLINQSLRELLQASPDVRGKTMLQAFGILRLADVVVRLRDRPTVHGVELKLSGPTPRWVELNASALLDAEGHHDGALFIFHDRTRLRQLENTRREFVANVSHELRTPLSLIKGFLETLLDGAKDNPEQAARFLQTIQRHANRLAFLIEDLLTAGGL
jgi:two-component system phosphate regulon sensor histidine kinase PhoR